MKFSKSSLAIALSLAYLPISVYANSSEQQAIETITVSSHFKKQSLASMPTSIAIISEQQILEQGDQHFENVLTSIANVNFAGGSSRPKYLQIRGVGERSEYRGAPNSSVGFIVDDIDLSGLGMAANMFDIGQVEILRGPQGTRFGANALAGLVYVQSNTPTETSEHAIKTSFGDDDLFTIGGFSSGALTEKLNYRISLEQHQQNGFRDNTFLNKDDTNGIDELSGKIKLAYQANDELAIDFTMLFADMNNGYDAWTLDNNGFQTLTDKPGVDNQKSLGSSFKIAYKGLAQVDITAISSFTTTDHQHVYDGDWANPDYWAGKSCADWDTGELTACEYDYLWDKQAERDVYSQEIRFNNKMSEKIFSQTTDWLLGLYFSELEESNIVDAAYNGWPDEDSEVISDYQAKNIAVFGQLDSQLTDDYQLSIGLRVEKRTSDYFDDNDDMFNPSESMWGGHIALSKVLTDEHNGYFRISKGYKAGGFNMALPDELSHFKEFETESLINYEFGLDSLFANNTVHSRLAVFYMDREDQQVNASQQDPDDPQRFTIYTANATSSSSYGAELDLTWQATDSLQLYSSVGYLRATYDQYAYFDKYGSEIDISDRELAHAPKFTYSVGVSYHHDNGLFVNSNFSGKSGFYFSDSHDEKAENSQLLNARIGYQQELWSLTLWVRNITDEKIATRGFYFGNEPDIDWAAKKYQRFAAPRQVGITLDYQF